MATVIPDRSVEQRREALELANDVRFRRAELKRDLKAGRQSVVPLLTDRPDWLRSMPVFDLLMAIPYFGRIKVGKTLNWCEISPSRLVGNLSERQRLELVGLLRRGR